MRWLKIIPAVIVVLAMAFGVSSAQQALTLFTLVQPEIVQPLYKEIVCEFDTTDYQQISMNLKSPTKIVPDLDRIGHIQRLVNSSV